MNLCDIEQIKKLLSRHGFHFSKSLGQNFLIEPWVPQEIAAVSGAGPGCGVLEIGPGIGPLTVELCQRAQRVVSVEIDRSLLPILEQTLDGRENVTVISGDIMKTNLPALVEEHFAGLTPLVCANLPYQITTPVLSHLLESGCFQTITVMIQREVARRICAAPGTADYGAFSLFCQYHAQAELLFDVGPECFLPAPKVTSSVLQLRSRPAPAQVDDPAHFFALIKAAFAQRRKTLLNALSAALGSQIPKPALQEAILRCGLPADVRGERLGIVEFADLSKEIRKLV